MDADRDTDMRRKFVTTALVAIVIFLLAALGWSIANHVHEGQNERDLVESAQLVTQALTSEFSRIDMLTSALQHDAMVAEAIENPQFGGSAPVNDYLLGLSLRTGNTSIFVFDAEGNGIGSNLFAGLDSVAATNFGDLPYVAEALSAGQSTIYAQFYTNNAPGLYSARRIDLPSGEVGVVAAKVDLSGIETSWAAFDSGIALLDRDGVVFLSNHDEWKYHLIQPLPASVTRDVTDAINRRYVGLEVLERPTLLSESDTVSEGDAVVDKQRYIYRIADIGDAGWQLLVARPAPAAHPGASVIAVLVALIGLIVANNIYIYRQRGQIIRLQDERNVLLERRVEERTRELAMETDIRQRTEKSLRNAENDLVQAAKLAALGQMSAALAHEVSQPVTALAATLTAAERRLASSELDNAQQLVERAQSLTRRIQHVIRHLRSFSKKDNGVSERLKVATSMRAALELAETRAREIGVIIAAEGLETEAEIAGVPVRFEQVLINLLLNALDAVAGREGAEVGIRFTHDRQSGLIEIWDNGPGIPEELVSRLAEPFFTTKSGADGLGLGLSISQSILSDLGASMGFEPREGGGTVCRVRLALADADVRSEAAE